MKISRAATRSATCPSSCTPAELSGSPGLLARAALNRPSHFGADRKDTGTVELDDQPIDATSRAMPRAGTLPAYRGSQIAGPRARSNRTGKFRTTCGNTGGLINRQASDAFAKFVKQVPIKVSDHEQLARNLSGGNQQKVVLAKWLQRNADVIIFDEPTRGIDVAPSTRFTDSSSNGRRRQSHSRQLRLPRSRHERPNPRVNDRLPVRSPRSTSQEDIMKLATQREPLAA